MPSIRAEQFASLQSANEHLLIKELLRFIQEEHADIIAGYPDALVKSMIFTGLHRARSWGINETENLFSFVGLMFAIAPNFDEQANIHHQLAQGRGTPDQRMLALMHNTCEADWEQAEANYDSDAWETVTHQ